MAMLATGWGYVESETHCNLFIEALTAEIGRRHSTNLWLVDFDNMVEFAQAKGWVSADGKYLQAHIQRV